MNVLGKLTEPKSEKNPEMVPCEKFVAVFKNESHHWREAMADKAPFRRLIAIQNLFLVYKTIKKSMLPMEAASPRSNAPSGKSSPIDEK